MEVIKNAHDRELVGVFDHDPLHTLLDYPIGLPNVPFCEAASPLSICCGFSHVG